MASSAQKKDYLKGSSVSHPVGEGHSKSQFFQYIDSYEQSRCYSFLRYLRKLVDYGHNTVYDVFFPLVTCVSDDILALKRKIKYLESFDSLCFQPVISITVLE